MTDSRHVLQFIERETGPNPTQSVIWLHGLGADGHDFEPLVPALGITTPTRFIFPHAPVRPVTINGGMAMRAWYDILTPALVRVEDDAGIRESEQMIADLIKRENGLGVATENIVLAGFSQGCAMTLHTGLRYPEKLGGLIGLSGYLPLADRAAPHWAPANQQTAIFLAHGTHDPVVALERGESTKRLLVSHGYQVNWHTYPMQHSVCPEEVHDIAQFMKSVLR
ncbi:MAG: carboxylesterase [Burkholderiaceae bacterium]|nr:carboxylesterase [Burkholderiaceae bacterium]MCD8517733.1 carboxylesterase [Burkholderiaceae bacterium]MCD8564262.1 carboxylesterase [Burkholderiaceae bacterium]